jgi:hypothetical protein
MGDARRSNVILNTPDLPGVPVSAPDTGKKDVMEITNHINAERPLLHRLYSLPI